MYGIKNLQRRIKQATREAQYIDVTSALIDTLKKVTDKFDSFKDQTEKSFELLTKEVKSLYREVTGLDKRVSDIEAIEVRDGKDGKDGLDGYNPIKGVDYFDGKDGKDGKSIKGPKGDKGDPGRDGSEISPQDIVAKLEGLSGQERLDAKAIKNLPQGTVHRMGSQGIRQFTKLKDAPKTIEAGKFLKGSSDGKSLEFSDDSAIDHDSLLNTHNLTTDIDHDTITNNHNLTTDIDHNTITNNHNLTTDIDHNALDNYEVGEHRTINDSATGVTDLWSANKINSELGNKLENIESESIGDLADFTASTTEPTDPATGDIWLDIS